MKKIVLTGGPCSGKTTVIESLKQKYSDRIIFVPEIATMLLSAGFPVPGQDIAWSQEWQDAFQAAVLPLQINLEKVYCLKAKTAGIETLICDRGILDGAAYCQDGLSNFCLTHRIDHDEALNNYEMVIHLESLATAYPHLYGQTNNQQRFESLEEAQQLELKTRLAWANHANHNFVTGKGEVENKIAAVSKIIKKIL